MKKTKIQNVLEYFSSTLVLSYFFIHNIFLVLIGIAISLYFININFINEIITSINKNLVSKKESIGLNINNTEIKTKPISIKSNKEGDKFTLVETIEELGFIPSLEKNDESNVA